MYIFHCTCDHEYLNLVLRFPVRRDHLSEAIIYHNEEKEENMVSTLVKRLSKAIKKEAEYSRKLRGCLESGDLREKDLPAMLEGLRKLASDKKGKKQLKV